MSEKPSSLHLFADVLARVHAVCGTLAAEEGWPAGIDLSRVVVEPPRDPAEKIAAKLRADDLIASVDIAGPGFINLTLKPQAWSDALRTMLREGAAYGRGAAGAAGKVNVESVSANPTGPMHVGHCRGAVFGDALA